MYTDVTALQGHLAVRAVEMVTPDGEIKSAYRSAAMMEIVAIVTDINCHPSTNRYVHCSIQVLTVYECSGTYILFGER